MSKLADLLKTKAQIEAELEAIRVKEEGERIEKERQEAARKAEEAERKESVFYYFQVNEASKPFSEVIDEELLKDPKFIIFFFGVIKYIEEHKLNGSQIKTLLSRVIQQFKEENQIK